MRRTTRRARLAVGLVLTAVAGSIALAAPAGAAQVTGCRGTAQSIAEDGTALHDIAGPGAGGTQSDPFRIDWEGEITWQGDSNDVLRNGTWRVVAESLLPIPLSGSFENAEGTTHNEDSIKVSDEIPLKITGKYLASFRVTGEGGAPCRGEVWLHIIDSPMGTPLWFVALGLIVVGAALVGGPLVRALLRRG